MPRPITTTNAREATTSEAYLARHAVVAQAIASDNYTSLQDSRIRLWCCECGGCCSRGAIASRIRDGWVVVSPQTMVEREMMDANDDYVWAICASCNRCRPHTCSSCSLTFGYRNHPRIRTELERQNLCEDCYVQESTSRGLVRCENCLNYIDANNVRGNVVRGGVMASYCNTCYRDRLIMPYNANTLDYHKFMGKPRDKMFFGVELEVEVNASKDFYEVVENTHKSVNDFAIMKHDGSLYNGFEIVSAPMSMEVHKSNKWKKFFRKGGNKGLRAHQTTTCGMHVHISRDALSPMTIGKVTEFIHSRENVDFIRVISGRNSNHYCAYGNDHKKTAALPRYRELRGRYNAVNLANPNTLEIRIFRGTVQRAVFLKNLEFCEAIVKFSQTHSMGEAKSKDLFAYWVMTNHKDYPYLASFLKDVWFKGKKFVVNYVNSYIVERARVGKKIKDEFETIKRKKERETQARQGDLDRVYGTVVGRDMVGSEYAQYLREQDARRLRERINAIIGAEPVPF